jgi:hypothetical protein
MGSLVKVLVNFAMMVRLENLHPLQAGMLRLKHPSERRPGLPRESSLIFWPRFAWQTFYRHAILAGTIARLLWVKMMIERDPDARAYTDQALTPVCDDDDMTLDLLTKTTGGRVAVAHIKKVAELTGGRTRIRDDRFAISNLGFARAAGFLKSAPSKSQLSCFPLRIVFPVMGSTCKQHRRTSSVRPTSRPVRRLQTVNPHRRGAEEWSMQCRSA